VAAVSGEKARSRRVWPNGGALESVMLGGVGGWVFGWRGLEEWFEMFAFELRELETSAPRRCTYPWIAILGRLTLKHVMTARSCDTSFEVLSPRLALEVDHTRDFVRMVQCLAPSENTNTSSIIMNNTSSLKHSH
jgi:hypothetical protein